MAAAAAAVFALAPTTALGQRGTSSGAAEPTAELAADHPTAVDPSPRTMQRCQMQRGRMRGMQAGSELTEQERLERMREHMVAGMRRMAVRMTAVQNRIRALERSEPDSAPPVEMGRGMMGGDGDAGANPEGAER